MEILGHKPCFTAFNGPTSTPFGLQDPFEIQHIEIGGEKDQIPCLVLKQGLKFEIHGKMPF